jgi:hypothetical protein
LALLGLEKDAAAAITAEQWLLGRQEPIGAWRYRDMAPATHWSTPIVLLALNGRGHDDAVERGMNWLLAQKGQQMPWLARVRDFLSGTRTVDLDTSLDGWAWAEGTFAWVEPTAWALMAIKAIYPNGLPRGARARVREGEAMLLDRACPGGGWNYGNKRVLDVALEPYPDTTAIALLGLHGHRAPEVEAGFDALGRLLGPHASGLALSLAALSHRAWQRDATHLIARLTDRYEDNRFLSETRTLALAALATDDSPGWFGARRNA